VAAYFLDSSGAAKRYVVETGTGRVLTLCDPAHRHELFLVRITAIEIAAVLFRRVRAALLAAADAARASAALRSDLTRLYQVVEVTPSLLDQALGVAERHGLRGYDCVQLAGALGIQQARAAAGLSPLTLVSADAELNAAAQAEGLTVEDPNDFP
jgi:predicted nucleic acid-binding protein